MGRKLGRIWHGHRTTVAPYLALGLRKEAFLNRRPGETMVKEIGVMPDTPVRDTIPIPDDRRYRNAEDMALNGSVLSTVKVGGAGGTRTPGLLTASQTLSQLSYSPTVSGCSPSYVGAARRQRRPVYPRVTFSTAG